jgi:hypothetical protein
MRSNPEPCLLHNVGTAEPAQDTNTMSPAVDSPPVSWAEVRLGVLNNLKFTGDDFFADREMCRIVAERVTYIAGEPADDARFVAVFAHALEHTGGNTEETNG